MGPAGARGGAPVTPGWLHKGRDGAGGRKIPPVPGARPQYGIAAFPRLRGSAGKAEAGPRGCSLGAFIHARWKICGKYSNSELGNSNTVCRMCSWSYYIHSRFVTLYIYVPVTQVSPSNMEVPGRASEMCLSASPGCESRTGQGWQRVLCGAYVCVCVCAQRCTSQRFPSRPAAGPACPALALAEPLLPAVPLRGLWLVGQGCLRVRAVKERRCWGRWGKAIGRSVVFGQRICISVQHSALCFVCSLRPGGL